ncbi:hypothetical protein L6164_029645 [Bauhinia variegata]|uniref:Uncharacterized protein n=1 Tax=Bauhinia variegata TaxID=167791 RepID=A0ACB9LAB1_BAUVA|nr:hypothetical protein L6164_029645 [Bauhinia variegata]
MANSASSSSTQTTKGTAADPEVHLMMELRRHEVAIAELNNLPSIRAVYQRNGNLFFRTTIEKATLMEHKQIDSAKGKLRILDSSSQWVFFPVLFSRSSNQVPVPTYQFISFSFLTINQVLSGPTYGFSDKISVFLFGATFLFLPFADWSCLLKTLVANNGFSASSCVLRNWVS